MSKNKSLTTLEEFKEKTTANVGQKSMTNLKKVTKHLKSVH